MFSKQDSIIFLSVILFVTLVTGAAIGTGMTERKYAFYKDSICQK